jgi:hypothetical protein
MKRTAKVEPKGSDYLMWVGSIYYPQVNVFIEEAKVQGVCKRLGHIPSGLVPGASRIFLAHDDGMNGNGFIFGYFTPDRLEYLTTNEMEIPANIYDLIDWVDDWSDEEERECGVRREGLYAVSKGIKGKAVFFKHPRDLNYFDPDRTHFRGLLQIDYGSQIIKAPRESFVTPPSWTSATNVTEIGDDELVETLESSPSISYGAQALAYQTGQSKSAITYRYNLLTGRIKCNSLDGAEDEAEALEKRIENHRKLTGKSYIDDHKDTRKFKPFGHKK